MAYTDEQLKEAVPAATTISDVARALGYQTKGGGVHRYIKKRILALGLDTSHFKGKAHGTSSTARVSFEQMLTENSEYQNQTHLKRRLINSGRLIQKCTICGITDWLGQPIVLQLDHLNGINNDNRIENLRLLCPNCHSQTETFAGKNNRVRSSAG